MTSRKDRDWGRGEINTGPRQHGARLEDKLLGYYGYDTPEAIKYRETMEKNDREVAKQQQLYQDQFADRTVATPRNGHSSGRNGRR